MARSKGALRQEKAEPPAQNGKAQPTSERKHWLDYIAFLAVVAASAAAAFAFWQGWITRETSQSAQRAYVFVRSGGVLLSYDEKHAQAFIDLVNFGRTPGYDFKTWTKIVVASFDAVPYDETGTPKQRSIIGPSAGLRASSKSLTLTPIQMSAISNRYSAIFAWGSVRYRDAFERCWEFLFRIRVSGPFEELGDRDTQKIEGIGWGLSPDPRYGYSEEEKKCADLSEAP